MKGQRGHPCEESQGMVEKLNEYFSSAFTKEKVEEDKKLRQINTDVLENINIRKEVQTVLMHIKVDKSPGL